MRNARQTSAVAAAIALMIGGGAALGAIASSFTSANIKPIVQSQTPMTQTEMVADVDQENAAKNWARTAFDGGLRQCPAMNAEFLAACQAEMKALAARPAFAPVSHGGPLLLTKVEQSKPEPEYSDPEQPAYRQASYDPPPFAEDDAPDDEPDLAEPQPY